MVWGICLFASLRQFSHRTSHVNWITRFILFHGKYHPASMADMEIRTFLSPLVFRGNVPASTQTPRSSARIFPEKLLHK